MTTLTTQTDQLTIAWWLREKHETTTAVELTFERAVWWTGDDDETWTDVEPGTPGAGTMHDHGEGEMRLRLTSDQAARFDVGRQYAFASSVEPLYEGE